MELDFSNDLIKFKKNLNSLDKFTLDFTRILEKCKIKYVVVSGYVSILFGRNRSSEDIDLIIEHLEYDKFLILWKEIQKKFECIISGNPRDIYFEYLGNQHSIRFSRKKEYIPNMELKFPKNELDLWSLTNPQEVEINKERLFISKIELQIPFKLFLGSEKDIEDAKYLYQLFKDKIDVSLMDEFNKRLKTGEMFNKYIKRG